MAKDQLIEEALDTIALEPWNSPVLERGHYPAAMGTADSELNELADRKIENLCFIRRWTIKTSTLFCFVSKTR